MNILILNAIVEILYFQLLLMEVIVRIAVNGLLMNNDNLTDKLI